VPGIALAPPPHQIYLDLLHLHSLCTSLYSSCSCVVITFAEIWAMVASDKRFGLVNTRSRRLDVRQREVDGEASSTVTVFSSPSYSYCIPAKYGQTTRVRAPVCPPPPVNVDDVMNAGHIVTNRGLRRGGWRDFFY
jgi:hypothetical protein